jgi:diadenosine tetraphosphate (Ap4A) HIT family hydrolase
VLESHPLAIAIADGFPLSQGHSLIVPRRHVASWFDLSNEEHGAIVELLDRLRERLDATYAPDAYNIGINDGTAAGQTVMHVHVHVHVIPRYRGDTEDPRGGVRWVLPGKAAYWTSK